MKERREQAGHFWRRRLEQPISEWDTGVVAVGHTSLVRLVPQSIMLVHCVERDFLESQSVTSKVTQVVPTHGVDVCLSNFISKLGMVSGQKEVEVFVSDECSLMNNLRIDAWRT